MSINENLNKLVRMIINKTYLSTYFINFENINIIDSNDDLLDILNICNTEEMKCRNSSIDVKLNILPNSIIIPYYYIPNKLSSLFYCIVMINDAYEIKIYDIDKNIKKYSYYNSNFELDLQSIMLYEKIKRERGK
mgnify:CR=1 FL=1